MSQRFKHLENNILQANLKLLIENNEMIIINTETQRNSFSDIQLIDKKGTHEITGTQKDFYNKIKFQIMMKLMTMDH